MYRWLENGERHHRQENKAVRQRAQFRAARQGQEPAALREQRLQRRPEEEARREPVPAAGRAGCFPGLRVYFGAVGTRPLVATAARHWEAHR